ncbi:flagellar hook-length control protein FliK [Bacillus norwichensis]|nr:flagellar hook-length control protein FliK [Bacillus norwichensis]
MRIPIFEASPNLGMVNQPENKSGQGNGLFGDILNMKLQSFQSEPTNEVTDADEEQSDLIDLLTNVLGALQELQENGESDLDEDEQELLQQAIHLLEDLKETELPKVTVDLELILNQILVEFEQLDSNADTDIENLDTALKELTNKLEQSASLNSVFPKIGEPHFLVTGQLPVKQNMPTRWDIKSGNSDKQWIKDAPLQFISNTESAETKEERPGSIRLETVHIAKEGIPRIASLTENTAKVNEEIVNRQTKSDSNTVQASSVNRKETEEVIVRLAETGSNERKGRELVRQFTTVLQKSHFSQGLQTKSMTIRLYPEHLGSLRIELTQRDGAMIARILTSTSMAKDMLDSQIHQLRQAFTQQNIQVDKVEVSFQEGLESYSSQDRRNSDQEQPGSDQSSEESTFVEETEEEGFTDFLQKVLFEMEV